MNKMTKSMIGILIVLLGLWGSSWIVVSLHESPVYAETPSDETDDAAEDEGDDENDEQDAGDTNEKAEEGIKLSETAQVTLAYVRDFWKREEVTPGEKIKAFPPFVVPPRKTELENYPCLDCHEDAEINKNVERTLTEEHTNIVLDHGEQRFWCLNCHNLNHMNYLKSLKDQQIDFNQSYLLCGQCHAARQKDWYFGAHGKRIGNWNGERQILVCTECHDPHSPSIKPKQPDPPPRRHHAVVHVSRPEHKSTLHMWNIHKKDKE
ncbi:MAG: hypothetical protein HQM11_15370 [SAR324 cluster bacterium]|nr:hypothetical protein [SAR324 cluster bacterium]